MKRILLSGLEVFELTDGGKFGLVIGMEMDEREMMVAYAMSLRQSIGISCVSWKTHLDSLKKAEMPKPTATRSPTKKPDVFNIYNC
jgi:hypothetical protein